MIIYIGGRGVIIITLFNSVLNNSLLSILILLVSLGASVSFTEDLVDFLDFLLLLVSGFSSVFFSSYCYSSSSTLSSFLVDFLDFLVSFFSFSSGLFSSVLVFSSISFSAFSSFSFCLASALEADFLGVTDFFGG